MLGMIWSRSRVLCMVRKLLYRGQEAWIVVLQGLTGGLRTLKIKWNTAIRRTIRME